MLLKALTNELLSRQNQTIGVCSVCVCVCTTNSTTAEHFNGFEIILSENESVVNIESFSVNLFN